MLLQQQTGQNVITLMHFSGSNAELVEGLKKGIDQSKAAFYDEYAPVINRIVWRLLGPDTEHDDVVHQVFLHILASIKKIQEPEALNEWVRRVAINTVKKEIRRRKYRRIVFLSPKEIDASLSSIDTETDIQVRQFYRILDKLRAEDRIVLFLRYVEEHTIPEIAEIGGYSLATANRRLARAKKAFFRRVRNDAVLASVLEDSNYDQY